MKNTVLYPIYVALVIFTLNSLDSNNPDLALGMGGIFLVPVVMALITGRTFGGTSVVHWKKEPSLFWSAMAIWIALAVICLAIGFLPPETFSK